MSELLLLPRPDQETPTAPVKGPSEDSLTGTFGHLLPPAEFLTTSHGDVAYYDLQKLTVADRDPTRVLMIHGVQTPALGLLPLANAVQDRFPGASIVLFDLYGHGLSSTPIKAHTPNIFHDLISALLEHIGWTSAHMIGYSFGGNLLAGYLASNPDKIQSATFLAPAGLMRSSNLDEAAQGILKGKEGEDGQKVRDWVFDFLEGGDLIVPSDWKARVSKGEVVAEAIRDWELKNHAGYQASVISIVRDGGIFDNHEAFRRAVGTGKKHLVVLGEKDEVASKSDCEDVGLANIMVVESAGHAVVRTHVAELMDHIEAFWKEEVGLRA